MGTALELDMDTFWWNFELSTLNNLDIAFWLISRCLGNLLDLLNNLVALEDLAEDNVFAIEMTWSRGGDEELRSIGILSCIGHTEKTNLGVLELEVLIWELLAIDGLSTSAIALCEITALDHESRDNTMEVGSFISIALLSSCQCAEVLNCLGNRLSVQTHHNSTHGVVAMLDVEVNLVCDLGALGSFSGLSEEQKGNSEDQQR